MSDIEQNRGVLEHWYDHMWGRTDFDLIPEIAAAKYMRHDVTGANNLMPAEAYRDMLKPVLGHLDVEDFQYHLTCEGEFVGALGRFLLAGDRQWDWVQVFRVEHGRLAETWLTGMGGTDVNGYPHPRNVWTGTEIPADRLPESANKQLVSCWLNHLAAAGERPASDYLAARIRAHDLLDADRTLAAEEYETEMRRLMNAASVAGFRHMLIGEGEMVFAICSWTLDGERQWDWVQAFAVEDGRIARTWLPAIAGTDGTLSHGPGTRWPRRAMPAGSMEPVRNGIEKRRI